MYYNRSEGRTCIILVYVDDYLVATDDEEYFGRFLESFKEFLKDGGQKVKHLGTPENLLQMKVGVQPDCIKLSQIKHIEKSMETFWSGKG